LAGLWDRFLGRNFYLAVFIPLNATINMQVYLLQIAEGFFCHPDFDQFRFVLVEQQFHPLANEFNRGFKQAIVNGYTPVFIDSAANRFPEVIRQIIRGASYAFHI
jgi:hypothetical protein